ncbi:hypothetical protein O6H91_12G106700 [Diphasiastrum complanatum]|uniref:Uncharacterized protein n=2 Tax=Diphasiastrum complanatum TaxID=34168 RepID=A0ACC2C5P4_DIPCM|nr:hypothetical protein O6H91_12G106700 [Diphasiastrum complanatum]KAJ7537290.1 hypothetical protein O6H91_12G106700 [Diphasiastrum complanatum]
MGGNCSKRKVNEASSQGSKIEKRMVEAMKQRATVGATLKSFNSILVKFPKIDNSFEEVRTVFKKFDKDGSGKIDLEELKTCFRELQVEFTDEEVKAFHEESDMDANKGIDFKEFIVVLALLYLLGVPTNTAAKSRIGLPKLETTFETIVDAFVFFDKDGDGFVSKKEMMLGMNESGVSDSSSGNIGIKRFEEMDWNRNGTITFKEFLFAFTDWVGIDENDEN